MTSQTKELYLERNGTACPYCSSPDLELRNKYTTTEIRGNKAFLLVPVVCDTCGWTGQERYQLVGVDNLPGEEGQ